MCDLLLSEKMIGNSRTWISFYFLAWSQCEIKRGKISFRQPSCIFGLREEINNIVIRYTTSLAYSQQGNGLTERMNRSLPNKVCPMLVNLTWTIVFGWALLQAGYLHNSTVTPVLDIKTPQDVLLGNAPNNSKNRYLWLLCTRTQAPNAKNRKLGRQSNTESILRLSWGIIAYTFRVPGTFWPRNMRRSTDWYFHCLRPYKQNNFRPGRHLNQITTSVGKAKLQM